MHYHVLFYVYSKQSVLKFLDKFILVHMQVPNMYMFIAAAFIIISIYIQLRGPKYCTILKL